MIDWEILNAARAGDEDQLTQVLKQNSAAANTISEDSGADALHMAAANGHLNVIKLLVLGNSNINIDISNSDQKRLGVIKKIRDTQGYLTVIRRNFAGNTPLHWALQMKQWEAACLVMILFYDQVDVLQKNNQNQSAVSLIMDKVPSSDDDIIYGHLMNLILEHPSAAPLEIPLNPQQ